MLPVDIPEAVINDGNKLPRNIFEQNRREDALQNAFKAIECIIGDPPRDDKKLFNKLKKVGIDPNYAVGYKNKGPIYKEIREMNAMRDKKAAHGSTPKRGITLIEMLDYQDCAVEVIWHSIEHFLGDKINL